MAARQALLDAATSYLRSHPEEIVRVLRNAIGLRFGVPIASLRFLAGRGDGGPKDIEIDPDPPGIRVAATLELMGTTVRANTSIFIERIKLSAEELRLEIRLEGTTLRVLGDSQTPVAALIRSGALDLTKSGNLAAHMPKLGALLGESTGNRLVIDLMKHPKIGKNKAVRRVLGLMSSIVTVHGVESDDGHLDVLLRAFPRGVGGAVRAVRDHLFTDGPPWIRGMLPAVAAKHARATELREGRVSIGDSASDHTQQRTVVESSSQPAPLDADEVGPEIGRYLVIDEIGAGGMGQVFRAYDPKLGREVALKRLRLRARGGETDGARMLREAKAMAMLSHPNVVPIYDVDIDHGTLFIAMEYVRGATLKTWVAGTQRSWREVLTMFVQAGRGLAAAHAEGIVHRDFKPSNVVVGADGRPRVMDFGLARAFGSTAESGAFDAMPPALASPLDGEGDSGDLGATLTALGTVVGTPPYMAPEQHMGEPVDARTDQYAFCVALWEALHRKPAFAGRTASELAARKIAGPPKPPTSSGVPAQLHVLLARGLAPDPSARWPDMTSLLAALERAATPRRWRWPLFAGAAVVLVAGGAWWIGRAPPCSSSEAELADTWGPEQRASVEQALRASHATFAESTVTRVTATLDATADAWIAMHRDACAASKVRHEQSDEALDLRMTCLRARKHELAGVVALLATGGSDVTEHAVEVATGLAPIEHCADVAALRERVPPPEQAGVRELVEDIRARLADARNVARAGKLADGLALIEATQPDAMATDYVPIQIEVELARADVLVLLDRDPEARPLLEHALDTGLAQRDEHAAGLAAVELAGLLMRGGARAADLQWLARIGLGLAEGHGQDPQLLADAMIMHGEVLADRELEREAEPYYAAAVALMERERGPNHPALVSPLLADAEIVRALGRHEESKQIVERALAIVEEAYGPDHPQVGRSLIARGWAALGDRRFADAEADFARAERIAEDVFGPAHHATWSAMAMRAAALAELHRYDEAIAMIESALARMNKPEERAHPTRASMLHNLARVYSKKGDHERSAELFREVVELRREYGHQGMLAAGLGSLGGELEALERWDEAERVLQEASQVEAAAHADDGPHYSSADTQLAKLARRRGELRRARELLERGVALIPEADEPTRYAEVRFELAQVLWELGEDRDRAIALVEAAIVRLGELPDETGFTSTTEMRAWLEQHRPRTKPPSLAPHG